MMEQQQHRKKSAGFTLIEISIVLLIVSISIPPLIQMYINYLKVKAREDTHLAIENASSYIQIYPTKFLNYPCPASRAAGQGTADYGLDYCAISSTNRAAVQALASPGCLPNNAICKVPGSGDKDGNGTVDFVLIGAVPFKTLADGMQLAISADDAMLDGWGNMLTYAVSENITTLSNPNMYGTGKPRIDLSADYRLGAITAVDEFNNPTAGINGDGQFVIISHGPDKVGAYTRFGVQGTPCSTTSNDRENCDLDSIFMSSIVSSVGDPATHYDDLTYFYKNGLGELWKYFVSGSGSTTGSIQNLNSGNVGVGTITPLTKLDLGNSGILRTPTVNANMICKPDATGTGTRCLPVAWLLNGSYWSSNTNNITTPSGTVNVANRCSNATDAITGISASRVQCSDVRLQAAASPGPVQCDTGAYLSGVLTNGCILCSAGTTQKCP